MPRCVEPAGELSPPSPCYACVQSLCSAVAAPVADVVLWRRCLVKVSLFCCCCCPASLPQVSDSGVSVLCLMWLPHVLAIHTCLPRRCAQNIRATASERVRMRVVHWEVISCCGTNACCAWVARVQSFFTGVFADHPGQNPLTEEFPGSVAW